MYKLEKDIILYKNQFEKVALNIYHTHYLDRCSIELDGILFRIKYMLKHDKDLDKLDEMKSLFSQKACELREIFSNIIMSILFDMITIPDPFKLDNIIDILAHDVKMDSVYTKFKLILISDSKEYLEYVDHQIPEKEVFNIFPNEFFRINTESYNDGITKAFPELFDIKIQDKVGTGDDADVYVHNFTFQTGEACSLNCTYCYQFAKSPMRMEFDTARRFIDHLLADQYGYINRYNSPAIIIEFIGGEPLLEIDLTRKIYEYFLDQCYELNHPWFTMHRLSICSNGMQYFDDKVQDFFKEYHHTISFNISIDGNKELHDTCRIQSNGEGSYDVDMIALKHYTNHYSPEKNSKMTLAPSNMKYLFESVIDFIHQGMMSINLNCVFEEGWNQQTALEEYNQLKKLADYILENDLEYIYIAIFRENEEKMMDKEYDQPNCFKAGTTILSKDGNLFIETLREGDLVYSASGTLQKVSKINKYHSNNNIRFRVTGAFPIHCTSDHKFFAKKFLYMGWKNNIHYTEPDFYPISELRKGDRIALPIIQLGKILGKYFKTLNIAYMLGVFIGDGNIPLKSSEVVITPGYDEDNFFFNKIKESGLFFKERKGETSRIYVIPRSAGGLNEIYFKLCQCCGHLAPNKHFPYQVFDSTIEEVKAVIQGYVDTDGYIMPDGKIKTNTTSKRLAVDLMNLLRAVGEYPTCYCQKRAGKSIILGREVNILDRYEVYWDPIKPNGHFMFKKDDKYNVMWAGIQQYEIDKESYDVYCPTLMPLGNNLEEHSLIANGISAKNCGGAGRMLALRPNGQFYPCIRYMPTSVGHDVQDLCIGTVDHMIGRKENSEVLQLLDNITRRSQNNDICYECPINSNCGSCVALGHTVYGTPNKRTNFICIQMIAEALANVYYWNLLNIKKPQYRLGVRKNVVPDEWSLLVINEEELKFLKCIETYSMMITMENTPGWNETIMS